MATSRTFSLMVKLSLVAPPPRPPQPMTPIRTGSPALAFVCEWTWWVAVKLTAAAVEMAVPSRRKSLRFEFFCWDRLFESWSNDIAIPTLSNLITRLLNYQRVYIKLFVELRRQMNFIQCQQLPQTVSALFGRAGIVIAAYNACDDTSNR
jgi:hypothetical protein